MINSLLRLFIPVMIKLPAWRAVFFKWFKDGDDQIKILWIGCNGNRYEKMAYIVSNHPSRNIRWSDVSDNLFRFCLLCFKCHRNRQASICCGFPEFRTQSEYLIQPYLCIGSYLVLKFIYGWALTSVHPRIQNEHDGFPIHK